MNLTIDTGTTTTTGVRRFVGGLTPLDARLEPWQEALLSRPTVLRTLLAEHGSPLNMLHVEPFERNIEALLDVTRSFDLPARVMFARKANKALAFVDAARERGWGVDVASHEELQQVLDCGVAPRKIIVTAAVKPEGLLRLAVEHGVTVVLDNVDEVRAIAAIARTPAHKSGPSPVAIRISGFQAQKEKLFSRFGMDIDVAADAITALWRNREISSVLSLDGIHFHLDGYAAEHRIVGLRGALSLVDDLRVHGFRPRFVDMGGGFPVRYLESSTQWVRFWRHLQRALLGQIPPLTYRNHGLGLQVHQGQVIGEPQVYPFDQHLVGGAWLKEILGAPGVDGDASLAVAVKRRGLTLYCEPGRNVLDGCGVTAARVAWVKDHPLGHRLVGLVMNRTQCRTGSLDFLVDPLLVPVDDRDRRATVGAEIPTFLTGAYCIENEMLSWRALRFPYGISVGDIVVWPNTAGYFMHFLESRSHQLPLARNVVVDPESDFGRSELDAIDR